MDYIEYVKSQVSKRNWEILGELNVNLDTRILANLWPDFVNFEKRKKSEIPFLINQLSEFNNPRVFDACLGSGAASIGLKLEGIADIVSNEIDSDYAAIAQREAAKHNTKLDITSHDWRDLKNVYTNEFDGVLCLGNSLTYLFRKEDQITVLINFNAILKPEGKLIIDERNYANHFFGNNYVFSGNFVYCGKEKVLAHPIYVSESMVVMEYVHVKEKKKAHLALYPFKKGEMLKLLGNAGFQNIKVYGDYKKISDETSPEFLTYAARKP